MARTSVVPMPSESVVGGATILPGVPLPSWGRPEEPVAPEPEPAPTPEPVLVAAAMAAPSAVVSVGAPTPSAPELPVPAQPVPEQPADEQPADEQVASVMGTPYPALDEPEVPVAETPIPTLEPLAAAPDQLEAPVVEPPTPEAAAEPGRRARHTYRFRRGATAAGAAAAAVPDPEATTPETDAEAIPQLAPPTPVPPRAELYAAAGAAPPTAPWGTPPATAPVDLHPPTTEPVDVATTAAHQKPLDVEDGAAQDEPSASRRTLVALGAIGGVLVLAAVAALVWPGFLVSQDTPTAAVPTPTASVARPVTLAAPASIAGLTRLTGAPADALTKAAAGTTLSGYTTPLTAVYATGTTPAATVLAWTASTPGSPADVATAFAGYQGATGRAVIGIAPVDTGTLGGRMSCGSSVVGTTPASVCFWADDATFGAVTVLKPADAAAGATVAVAIRTAVEKRT